MDTLEIVRPSKPISYQEFAEAVFLTSGLRLAEKGLTGRNPRTGEPFEIPLRNPVCLVEICDKEDHEWYPVLEFRALDGTIIGADNLFPLSPDDPHVKALAEQLGAEVGDP